MEEVADVVSVACGCPPGGGPTVPPRQNFDVHFCAHFGEQESVLVENEQKLIVDVSNLNFLTFLPLKHRFSTLVTSRGLARWMTKD
jgi:hypothetical protein